ncbi:class I SAM-dependent methyltransferase [bacterium]|nr:class I SAM-dependent methyltransferase [bacterium]
MEIAHALWKKHLLNLQKSELTLVDATCGNGHDSLFLASFGGSLHCIDIQEQAIVRTKEQLAAFEHASYHLTSHEDLSFLPGDIDLIVYNLGYLPGSDKKVITTQESTLKSLTHAVEKLAPNGMISIMIYTGHEGGEEEKKCIINFLNSAKYLSYFHITAPKRQNCPETLLITRQKAKKYL